MEALLCGGLRSSAWARPAPRGLRLAGHRRLRGFAARAPVVKLTPDDSGRPDATTTATCQASTSRCFDTASWRAWAWIDWSSPTAMNVTSTDDPP
jgi:hypothetical protein